MSRSERFDEAKVTILRSACLPNAKLQQFCLVAGHVGERLCFLVLFMVHKDTPRSAPPPVWYSGGLWAVISARGASDSVRGYS